MIDVIFQLVLFLLVSSSFQIKPAITLDLSKSSTAIGTEENGIVVSISADDSIFLNGEAISFASLEENLSKFDSRSPVTVAADSFAKSGSVIAVFDLLRKGGFTEVNLRTHGQ